MLSYRLGTVNDFHWDFKPLSSYSKPHTFSTCLENKKKETRGPTWPWVAHLRKRSKVTVEPFTEDH